MEEQDGTAFFEYWSKLAREDPERFERERKRLIDETIASAPEHLQLQLRRVQWRVDAVRLRVRDPLVCASKVYGMLLDSFFGEYGFRNMLEKFAAGDTAYFERFNHVQRPTLEFRKH